MAPYHKSPRSSRGRQAPAYNTPSLARQIRRNEPPMGLQTDLPTNRYGWTSETRIEGLWLHEILIKVGYGHMQPEPPSNLEQDLRASRYSFSVPWTYRWAYHSAGVIVWISGERLDGYMHLNLSGGRDHRPARPGDIGRAHDRVSDAVDLISNERVIICILGFTLIRALRCFRCGKS
jgi:hypothetical protein